MRISDINHSSKELQKNIISDDTSNNFNHQKIFSQQLTSLSKENHQNYIIDLIDKISIQGKKISNKADILELQKYKKLITELLNDTVSNSYSYVKSDNFNYRKRHKVFTIIKKVNQSLDELTAEVLKQQSDNLNLLSTVGDIRGMLVDLFL